MKQVITTEAHPIKLWLSDIEDGALAQAKNVANLPFIFKWFALMPDAHQGYGMPIGGVAALKGVVCPNMVGVDIGCGMGAVRTNVACVSTDSLKNILGEARHRIPVGFNHHKQAQEWDGFDRAPNNPIIQAQLQSARKQLGTLGGGNHFIEIQQGNDGFVWLMLHSGSRNFGLQVAKHYHKVAQDLCAKWHVQLPDPDLAFLPTDTAEGQAYIEAMDFCLDFAQASRDHMMNALMDIFGNETMGEETDRVNIHHNYAAREHHYGENVWVHRKGATCVREGIRGIIPGSMGSSSFIVDGLGNPESFHSCSHGAGRQMGRKDAMRRLDLAEEMSKMEGIVHGIRYKGDLEEAPGAYKDVHTVMANQVDLVRIAVELKPLANMKG